MNEANRKKGKTRGEPADAKALLGAVAVVSAIVVLAGLNGSPSWSHGVRHAHAGPTTASASVLPMTSAPIATAAPSTSATAVPSLVPSLSPALAIGPGTRVLVFGDSFVDAGLSQQIKKLVESRGGKVLSNAWTSSTTTAWATGDKLAGMIASFKPDVVFVSIGANEVFLPAPETRAPYIRAIVKRFDKRPCVWIGTPLWKGETGITAVEKANSSPCTYFDSNTLTIDRGPDKIHPSGKGGAAWADAVFAATVSPATPTP